MMQISNISRAIGPTLSRQLYMLAKQYDDVIDFTLGDPDIQTPTGICEAATEASMQGKTRYSPNGGIPELREAIATQASIETGLKYNLNNVAITIGATEAIYLALNAILNEGDEVIILAPYWVQYKNIVELHKAKPVIISSFTKDFEPDIDAIREAVTEHTKIIVYNSPNNPSGILYRDGILKGIAQVAQENHLYVFADEVYKSLVYGNRYPSITKYCPSENLLIFNSFSKQFAMTGWRVGYVIGNEDLIDVIIKLQQNIAVCAPTISQYAALEAITHIQDYSVPVAQEFARRREIILGEIKSCPKVSFTAPEGTFYVFVNIGSTGMDSRRFCMSLLEKEHVAMIPGIAFGDKFDDHVRLAFTLEQNSIISGAQRLKHFVNTL